MIPWWAAVAVGVLAILGTLAVKAAARHLHKHARTQSVARALHTAAGPLTRWEDLSVEQRQRYWNWAAGLLHGL